MKWFEYLKYARESTDYEKYLEENTHLCEDENIWEYISKLDLSENFIRRNRNKLNMRLVSNSSTLSESFIRDFSHSLDMRLISERQKLSKEFCWEFRYKLDWTSLLYRFKFPEDYLMKLIDDPDVNIDLGNIINNQSLSRATQDKLLKLYRESEIQKNLDRRKSILFNNTECERT